MVETTDATATRGLLTVQRALNVLSAFTESRPEWGVTELATHLQSHKPAIHRILWTLAQNGYVIANPRTSRYRLGPKLISLGIVAQRSEGLSILAQPILERLALATGESAILTIRDGSAHIVVAAADGPGPLHYARTVGASYPWYAGSTGHAIFAFLPDNEIDAMARMGFAASSPRGAHSIEEIRERYEKVRANGYSVSIREVDDRMGVIGAPVRDGDMVIGSICIAGVAEYIERAQRATIESVVEAAATLSSFISSGSNHSEAAPKKKS